MTSAPLPNESVRPSPYQRLPLIGFAILLAFVGTLFIWSAYAPLEGGIVANGVIAVDSNVRTVQHLEGGIVSEILVREGDRVRRGQPIVRLQNKATSSSLNALMGEYYNALAVQARLRAERDGSGRIAFPAELISSSSAVARAAMSTQLAAFAARKSLLANETEGYRKQIEATRTRIAIVSQQLQSLDPLMRQGLVTKTRVLALEGDKAELQGSIASYQASLITARNKSADGVLAELKDVDNSVYELKQKLFAAEDVANRTEISAPADGTVVGLNIHTVGGVIAPGATLMNIVPAGDELIVDANIDPRDRDQIRVGLPASIWLSALTRKNQKPLEAKVRTISADRIVEQSGAGGYYRARLQLDRRSAGLEGVPLQPGMSAKVMIRTGPRSTFNYLVGPLTEAMTFASR